MDRLVLKKLKAWKNAKDRQPLLLLGARQVGKTWCLKKFGAQAFEHVVYLNCELQTEELKPIFDSSLNPQSILTKIQAIAEQKIEPGKTLLILDEIQAIPRAITALKYFCEIMPDLAVAAAGSLLGLHLHEGFSFPVGKVTFLRMYPMTFTEFLDAVGQEMSAQLIRSHDWSALAGLGNHLQTFLAQYFCVGGMPGVVKTFVDTQDFAAARRKQREIVEGYALDFGKHAPKELFGRISQIWESMPEQLAKVNKRFVFRELNAAGRSRDYSEALGWLVTTGVVLPVARISAPKLPLEGYKEGALFKLYGSDVGLLACMAGMDIALYAAPSRLFSEFKGALAEQYVLNQLQFSGDSQLPLTYWASSGTAEVDVVTQIASNIVPIEVKAGINLKAKSLQVFNEKYQPEFCVRTSLADFKETGNLLDIPLYAAEEIPSYLQERLRAKIVSG